MSDYHEHSDLTLLGELRKLDATGFEGFAALDKTVGRKLIAIGAAVTHGLLALKLFDRSNAIRP